MNLSKVFDYLYEVRSLVRDLGWDFELDEIMPDDNCHILTIRLVSGYNGDVFMCTSYHNIFESDNPREFAKRYVDRLAVYSRAEKPDFRVETLYRG